MMSSFSIGANAQTDLPTTDPADPSEDCDTHDQDDYAKAEEARKRNEPPFVAPTQITAQAAQASLNVTGRWEAPVTWPFVFATAANLPDGRMIAWGANDANVFSGGTSTYAGVWDPTTGQITSYNHNAHSMFCAIPTMLEDGRVFVNGGDGTRERTSTFDYRANAWTRLQDMHVGRWYNGAVQLPGGRVFTAVGDPGSPYPELWTQEKGWDYLLGASLQTAVLDYPSLTEPKNWLPHLNLAPNGQIFHSGHTPQMNYIDVTGNGTVTPVSIRNDWDISNAPTSMYDVGKLLKTGGGAKTNRAIIIDLNGATPTKTEVAPMNNVRVFHNFVDLPTGEVMAVGGNTSGQKFSDVGSVLAGEIWNPQTAQWRIVAAMTVPRNYHSVALLMTDGRVWAGGGGLCGCNANHPDHEVFSPPYLFNADGTLATRPIIASAPAAATFGGTLNVQATVGMQRFTLIKMSGVTHTSNSDQRQLKLAFTTSGNGQYQLALPANANVLTPGYWMLFALNNQGVPSVAKVIQISTNSTGLTLISPLAPAGKQGMPISVTVRAETKLNAALRFSAANLPNGLAINETTGVISGIPTIAQSNATVVTVTDGSNTVSTKFDWPIRNSQGWIATQSSTVLDGDPNRAIDGNTDGAFSNGSTTHTDFAFNSWWQADLGVDQRIESIKLWNRTDCCSDRLSNFYVFVSATDLTGRAYTNILTDTRVWKYQVTGQVGNMLEIPAGVVGRYVRVQVADMKHLSLAELQIVSMPNLATGKAASQSSTEFGGDASRAVDGNTTGVYSANSTTHTSNEGNAWWQADLGTSYQLSSIRLHNRSDCCADRLSNFYVFVSSSNLSGRTYANIMADPSVWKYQIAGQAPVILDIPASISGRYVRVQLAGSNHLSLVEVQVFGQTSFTVSATAPRPVNTNISYTANNTGSNARFKWLFGDGTPETAYSASANTSHSFAQPGLYVVKLTTTDDSQEKSLLFTQAIYAPQTARRPTSSSNMAYETRTGNNSRVWVVNQDNDTVSVFDAATNAKLSEIAVGSKPRSIAIAPNGNVWVTNKGAATLSIINPTTLAVVQTVNLPYASQPFGIAFAPTGGSAFVVLEATGLLMKLDATNGAVQATVGVGANVRGVAITADGASVLVSRFITPRLPGEETATVQPSATNGGEIVVVNASAMTVANTVVLQHSERPDAEAQSRGIPNYVGALAISPDGQTAWAPSKQDNIKRGKLRDGNDLNFQNSVRAVLSLIRLGGGANTDVLADRIDHDNSGLASAAAYDPFGSYLFVALETSREVAIVDAYGKKEIARLSVGRAPQGVLVSPDGLRLYVSNLMDRSVQVFDLSALMSRGNKNLSLLMTVSAVATEKLPAPVLTGKQIFYDAKDPRLARDSYLSCAACHNDGGQDGRVWDFTGFGEGLRNTIALNGRGGTAHGFLHWSGNFDEVQDFEGQIRNFAGGTGLMTDAQFNTGTRSQTLGDAKAGVSADLDALAAYLTSLNTFAPSPYRAADGTLTADAVAGKAVFASANCAQCHSGTAFTNSGAANLQNIGTLKATSGKRLNGTLTGMDVPTLRDVWASGPYLHDGSAATLNAAVSAHNNVSLNAAQIQQVVAYLQQISNESTTNVALGKVVSASSSENFGTQWNLQNATDGLVSATNPLGWSSSNNTGANHTEWLSIDLGAVSMVNQVVLTPRVDGVNAGYGFPVDFVVEASQDNTNWTTVTSRTNFARPAGTAQTFAFSDAAARYVRITGTKLQSNPNDTNRYRMQFAEVQVFGTSVSAPVNVSQGKVATQSSIAFDGVPARAVDGSTNGNWSVGSTTHTNNDANAWWQVDLGSSYTLGSVVLFNRTDCCADRLTNFYVFVSSTDLTGRTYANILADATVKKFQVTGQAPASLAVALNAAGRYVRVQLAGTNSLSLAEVQVFGNP